MFCNIFFFFFFWGLDLFVVVKSRGWCRKWKQIWLFLIFVSLNCRGNIEHTLLLKILDLLIFIIENARTSATKYLHVLKTLHQCHIFCNSIPIHIRYALLKTMELPPPHSRAALGNICHLYTLTTQFTTFLTLPPPSKTFTVGNLLMRGH